MHKIILWSLSILLLSGCIAPANWRDRLDPEERAVTFVYQHARSKNDAYVAANEWIAKNYASPKDVIQMQDKEAGTIIVKAVYQYIWVFDPVSKNSTPVNVDYSLSVYVKDKKMKTEFNTGPVEGAGVPKYIPKEEMPGLLAYYESIHEGLISAVTSTRNEF